MKMRCAWCQKVMEDSSGSAGSRVITHGICDECLGNIEAQQGVELSAYLDSLNEPVLVIDDQKIVRDMNEQAAKLLGVNQSGFIANQQGLVFECQHARNHQGCEKSIHCSGCAIRIAVKQTVATGRGVHRQPATLTQDDGEVRLFISTEKVDDVILLRIDEADTP